MLKQLHFGYVYSLSHLQSWPHGLSDVKLKKQGQNCRKMKRGNVLKFMSMYEVTLFHNATLCHQTCNLKKT